MNDFPIREGRALPEESRQPASFTFENFQSGQPYDNKLLSPPEQKPSFTFEDFKTSNTPTTAPFLSQSMLDENAAQRAERVAALGATPAQPTLPIKDQVEAMSQADFDALSPLQQSAINFNTSLVRAVQHDLKSQKDYVPTNDERGSYNLALIDIFKDDTSASEASYAPETVALLKQIGYSDEDADLDDFLGLQASIHAEDLAGLKLDDLSAAKTAFEVPNVNRASLVRELAASTQKMDETLSRGSSLLNSSPTSTARLDRMPQIGELGGTKDTSRTSLGYGKGELDYYFQQAFDALANEGVDPKLIFGAINQDSWPSQISQFVNFADKRSGSAASNNMPLGNTPGVTYRTPSQFRTLLDLEGGDEDGG